MLKLKKIFATIILFSLMVVIINTMCYAESIKVTEEKLNTALQNFVTSSSNTSNYKITMSGGKIEIKSNSETYTVNYNLSGNTTTFTFSIPIKQGMTFSEFQRQYNKFMKSPIDTVAFAGISNVQGLGYADAIKYIEKFESTRALYFLKDMNMEYYIADDNADVTDMEDLKIIRKSEFGNHVMEYVDSVLPAKYTFSDEKMGGINACTWSAEKTDATETSCNILVSLKINPEADYSKIGTIVKASSSTTPAQTATQEPAASETGTAAKESTTKTGDATTSKLILPKAGVGTTIILGITLISIITIILIIKLKQYKDVK